MNAATRKMVRWASSAVLVFCGTLSAGCAGQIEGLVDVDSYLTDTMHSLESEATQSQMRGDDVAKVGAAKSTYDTLQSPTHAALVSQLLADFSGVANPPLADIHGLATQRVRELSPEDKQTLRRELADFARGSWTRYSADPNVGSTDPAKPLGCGVTSPSFVGAFVGAMAATCLDSGACN